MEAYGVVHVTARDHSTVMGHGRARIAVYDTAAVTIDENAAAAVKSNRASVSAWEDARVTTSVRRID